MKKMMIKHTTVLTALLVALLALAGLAPVASADSVISEPGEGAGETAEPQGLATDFETGDLYVADSHNHRVDVFNSEGHFAMAFGWGVADGAEELQSCGPVAAPPTVTCRRGLEGGAGGEFAEPEEIAVDNDPASSSHHDVYVLDRATLDFAAGGVGAGDRVEKFSASGEFLLAWGGGVITAGAAGSGSLVAGSVNVSNVVTTEKTFAAGQTITSPGKIPAGTTIAAVGPGTITLSKPATASGTAVPLGVAAGPGNVPVNEVQVLTVPSTPSAHFSLVFSTPDPSITEEKTPVDISSEDTATQIQHELEGLSNIGAGNVEVTGPQKGPYRIEFTGTRFSNTNVALREGNGTPGISSTLTLTLTPAPNGDSVAEVCTAAIAASCAGGVEGTGPGQFSVSKESVQLAVGPDGTVYVADCIPTGGLEATGNLTCKNRLQEFEPSGAFIKEIALPQSEQRPTGLAVNSSGDFYVVTGDGVLREYDPGGNLLPQTFAGDNRAIALDSFDNLYVSEGQKVAEYDPAGNTLRRFGYGVFKVGLVGFSPAPFAFGALDFDEGSFDRVAQIDFPPPGPVVVPAPCKPSFLGNTRAILSGEVNPEGKATTFHFEVVDQRSFETEGGFASPKTQKTTESASIGSDFVLHEANAEVSLVPETTYHCRVIATSADEPAGVAGEEGLFTSLPPLQIGPTWSTGVETTAAVLNAEVNPLGIPTTGYFEYVTEATYQADTKKAEEEAKSPKEVAEAGFEHATKTPAVEGGEQPIGFGAGESLKAAEAAISGLLPGTAYRYRIVASDLLIAPREVPGPAEAFRTGLPGEGGLPDARRYELVSPGEKNSAEVGVPEAASSIGFSDETDYRQILAAGAGSGEAMTYTSWTAFANPESAPATSQYLAKRTADGWRTENIFPAGTVRRLITPYRGFSAGLEFGALVVGEPALTKEASEGFDNLYLRDNQTGALQALTSEKPEIDPAADFRFCLDYAGASEDGTHAFFAANGSYAGAPKGTNFSLYEWSAANGLRPLSILPGQSTAVTPTEFTSFGAAGIHCESDEKIARHVVSRDGSRVFWTYAPESGATELLVRIDGQETLQLDKKATGGTGSGGGVFQTASADGSRAFFSDKEQLSGNAGEGDLYLYELPSKTLTDLTPAELTPGSEAAGVQGVVGASDDGSYVYFVAHGVLSGEEPNAAGEKAKAGAENLYLYHEGEPGVRFIGRLSSEDQPDWESHPLVQSARVSPDGRHLAFVSQEAEELAGYDNTVAKGPHCQLPDHRGEALQGGPSCPEVFLYDAEAKRLSCVSCNPTGARPLGPSSLPGWSNPFEGPRYISDDGSKLFFETLDALVPADENAKRDVYEFERPDVGTCTTERNSFDQAAGGCHFLVSSGKSGDESYLLDASSSGRDVFFSTRSSLVGWDVNENYDIYDAREGGGFAEPSGQVVCEAEACKPSALAVPGLPSPTTGVFSGLGNLAPSAVKPKPKPKPLTNAQKLVSALKTCLKKHDRHKRSACEAQARKRYGPKSKAKRKATLHKGGK